MKLRKLKSPNGGRLRRTALALGLAGGLVGGMLLAAGPADAAIGTQPGTVNLVPPTGATSSTPTWATTVGCPSGFQGSAVFEEVHADGTFTTISPVVNSSSQALTGAFTGTLQATIATIQSIGGIANGGTQELFVQCASGTGGTGNVQNFMDIFITYSADGTTYSTSNSAPATSTTTTLTTSSATTDTCTAVTLTATEVAADTTHPAGNVQFEVGGTALGSAVAVNASGVATMSTTFTSAGTFSVTAVFTPTSSSYSASTSAAVTETVTAGTTCNSGSEPLSVTIPASGTFTLTVPTTAVTLTVSGSTATGALNTITVSDTRNTFPGWSVSGQSSNFTGSGTAAGATISGNQLGWVPTDATLATGAALGPTVSPASPGLGTTAAILALAHAATPGSGFGTSQLGANLTLAIPTGQRAGPYAATMTITAVTSLA
jgi:Bacterial Ig-like domain (group 3)